MARPAFPLFAVAFALLGLLATRPGCAQPSPLQAQWAVFSSRFVDADGRVLDTGNKSVSHTEGQGWAMLFAETTNDRAAFEKIWEWTRKNLQRHDNDLFSWRWDPNGGKAPVADINDASDGDILIAWALTRAARRWHDAVYAHVAHQIVGDIRKRLLVKTPDRLLLLPGLTGFISKDGGTVVNPSYYIYPALDDFARLVPSPEWLRLRHDGLDLLADARFGRWGLTPDWVALDRHGDASPAAKFPPRFGFDAIRIPLYLIWGREATNERLASYLDFWNDYGGKPIPAWTDVNDNSVAPYPGSTGFGAIVGLVRGFGQKDPPGLPTIAEKDDYYAASLTLLAAIARDETTP